MWGITISSKQGSKTKQKSKKRVKRLRQERDDQLPAQSYPTPPPVPAPIPYGYPIYVIPYPESTTSKGLFLMMIAGVLTVIGYIVFPLIIIFAWILSSIGFFQIYNDRRAYPEPHPSNMKLSLLLYIIGILMLVFGTVFFISSFFSTAVDLDPNGPSEKFFWGNMIFSFGLLLSGAILMYFGRYKLLIELMPPNKKNLLKLALVFIILSLALTLLLIQFLIGSRLITMGFLALIGIYALALISHILFLYCFYVAHNYQKHNPQIRSDNNLYLSQLQTVQYQRPSYSYTYQPPSYTPYPSYYSYPYYHSYYPYLWYQYPYQYYHHHYSYYR